MKEKELSSISNAPWLMPRESRPVDASNLKFLNKRAILTWLWESTHRRSLRELMSDGNKSDIIGWSRFWDGAQIAMEIDFGDRASNGLMSDCLVRFEDSTKPSEFGKLLNRAMNNPKISDHNFDHGKRKVARTGEATIFNVGELKHEKSLRLMLGSMQLFYAWHDVDQVLTLQKNLDNKENNSKVELPSRIGHASAAAVMLMVLHRRYEQQRKISTKLAWKTCAYGAAMCLTHDNQKGFEKLKKAKNPGYEVNDRGELVYYLPDNEIYDLWKKNELDILQTTPAIVLKLLIWEKSEHGFVTKQSPHGLPPEFEEEYKDELSKLKNNHRPMVEDVNDFDREVFFLAAEVGNRADVSEMITPAYESLMRTLLEKSRSTKRPFWRDNLLVEVMIELVSSGSDNLPTREDSDGRRKLREFLFLGTNSQSEVFAKSRYINEVNKENALMGVLAFKLAGKKIMQGDLSIVSEVYNNRLKKIANKALRKSGYGFWNRKRFLFVADGMEDGVGFISKLLEKKDPQVAKNFKGKRDQFGEEIELIKQHLSNKPDGAEGLKIYSQKEVEHFLATTDRVVEILAERFQVTKRELNNYKKRVASFKYPKTLPYKAYDSLSLQGEAKTFVEPNPLVVELYKQIMKGYYG